MKKLLSVCSAAVVGLAALGFGSQPAAAAEPIKIGSVLSVTGPAAFLGEPELKTLQMYVDEINKKGGVLGRPLELVHYDDGSDASKANSFAKRLIESDHVDAIVGGTTSGSTMSMVPLVEKAQIPFVSLAGAVVIVDPVKPWVFKTPHTDRMAAEKVFADMQARGISKVALLSETSGFGQSGMKEAQCVAEKYGITLVANETYGPKDTDMSPQLTKIKGMGDVQALFVFGLGQGAAIVTKNYKQLGLDMPLYQSHGVASNQFLALAGDAAEGVRLPSPAQLVAAKLPDADPQKPVVLAYNEAFQARWGSETSTFGGYAYDGLMLMVHAMETAKSTEAAKVRDALEATSGYVGISGVFTMTATDHMGLSLDSFRMLEVKGGDWTLVQ
jgi:branched-chain amino acid transport system substrate-binding protein